MAEEEKDESGDEEVYNEEGREDMVDGDEISSEEEAFMKGYDERDEDDEEKEEEKEEEEEF